MYNKSFLIVLLFLLTQNVFLSAQYVLPKYQSQTTYKNQLLLRWEPRDVAEWEHALKEGYQIKVFQGPSTDKLSLRATTIVKAVDADQWDAAISAQKDTLLKEFYAGAKSFLFMPKEMEAELKSNLADEAGKSKQQTIEEFKLGYLNYAITFDFDLIQKAGLGHAIPIDKTSKYKIEVQTGNYPSYTFHYDPQVRATPGVPDLEATFSDKKVAVEWTTPAFKSKYFGYFLSISEDGKRYKKISDMPYVNLLDTVKSDPSFQTIQEDIPLPRNYKNYWIRLNGMNYFGLESRQSAIEKGYGFEVIDAMPNISHADQTSDNHADLRWTLDQRFNRLIDHFEIYRSDQIDGEYESVYSDIPASQRNIKIPMEHNSNYFSIAIVPKDGPIIRSFSAFVMGQDT
ncbi:MAG: hypothetical protein AAF985_18760, partial [Bacteroidota bacterium]